MRYFTRQARDALNRPEADYVALGREFDNSANRYREQLEGLLPRLPDAARTFFRDVTLHDGTLLSMRLGDDFKGLNTLIPNKRHLLAELQVLDTREENIFVLRYDRIHRMVFDFPGEEPWYSRFSDRGSNPIDDWMFDELTSVSDIMGEDVENENAFGSVVDPRDQSIVISMDIGDGSSTNNIGVGEITPHVGQRAPVGSPGNAIPVHQRRQCVVLLLRKLKNCWFADDPQCCSLQNVNYLVKLCSRSLQMAAAVE